MKWRRTNSHDDVYGALRNYAYRMTHNMNNWVLQTAKWIND